MHIRDDEIILKLLNKKQLVKIVTTAKNLCED